MVEIQSCGYFGPHITFVVGCRVLGIVDSGGTFQLWGLLRIIDEFGEIFELGARVMDSPYEALHDGGQVSSSSSYSCMQLTLLSMFLSF